MSTESGLIQKPRIWVQGAWLLPVAILLALTHGLTFSVLLSCGKQDSFRPKRDFSGKDALDGLNWKCHTTYAVRKEESRLEVVVYKAEYPGMEWPWAAGDWQPYRKLCFRAALGAPDYSSEAPSLSDSLDFHLSVWDGKGVYEHANRFHIRYRIGEELGNHCLELGPGLRAANGRAMDLSRIERVVFFTTALQRPLAFHLAEVRFF